MWRIICLSALAAPEPGSGHGMMTYPPSTRQGGSLEHGGDCQPSGACYWFTNNQRIPGEPTLPSWARSVNVNVSSGHLDWSSTNPWRAPGSAPVLGSGCGVAGGGPIVYANGGRPPRDVEQGADGLTLAKRSPTVWPAGSIQEVGMAVSANHAGGYSYRLCRNVEGSVDEMCFQKTPLKFAGDKQYIVYSSGNWSEIPLAKVAEGTRPAGSEWARFPVPSCSDCNPAEECGEPLPPTPGDDYNTAWNNQVNCNGACAGSASSKSTGTCPGLTQFPEPIPGLSGFGKVVWPWSIVDRVAVPSDLEPGEYLLSWRWDAEQSDQVFQNCADITISVAGTVGSSGVILDPFKKVAIYEPRGTNLCKSELYEIGCQGRGTSNEKDKQRAARTCTTLAKDTCVADPDCTWMTKDGNSFCWSSVTDSAKANEHIEDRVAQACVKLGESTCAADPKCAWIESAGKSFCWRSGDDSTKKGEKDKDRIDQVCGAFVKDECNSHPNCTWITKGRMSLCWRSSSTDSMKSGAENEVRAARACASFGEDACSVAPKCNWITRGGRSICWSSETDSINIEFESEAKPEPEPEPEPQSGKKFLNQNENQSQLGHESFAFKTMAKPVITSIILALIAC